MANPDVYLPKEIEETLRRQHYSLFGHSGVKLCHWTKQSLSKGRVCYKQKFYGIESHRCMQMSPAVSHCPQECVFCWRPLSELSWDLPKHGKVDSPKEIAERSIESQRVLLSGYGALREELGDKLEQARNPKHVAISLSGEPTAYSGLSGLIETYHSMGLTTFLVSNGMFPERLEKLTLPTQLYVSLESPAREMHKKINRPLLPDSWERLNKTLELLPSLETRTALRLTLIKGMNMQNEKEFAELILKAKPAFVELKSYMYVGYSRKRLKEENMPCIDEVLEFAESLNNHLGYNLAGHSGESRVALLWDGETKRKIDFK